MFRIIVVYKRLSYNVIEIKLYTYIHTFITICRGLLAGPAGLPTAVGE